MHNREFKFGYQDFLLCQKSFLKVSSKWLLKNKSDNGKLLLGKTYSGERFRAILALLFLMKGRKHCGKRRKCWLPAFSPFPTRVSKASYMRSLKVMIVW